MNIINKIIKKIRYKDKDLERMYVVIDEFGYIIGYSHNEKKLQHYIGQYNEAKDFQGVRKYELYDLPMRKKIKKLI